MFSGGPRYGRCIQGSWLQTFPPLATSRRGLIGQILLLPHGNVVNFTVLAAIVAASIRDTHSQLIILMPQPPQHGAGVTDRPTGSLHEREIWCFFPLRHNYLPV